MTKTYIKVFGLWQLDMEKKFSPSFFVEKMKLNQIFFSVEDSHTLENFKLMVLDMGRKFEFLIYTRICTKVPLNTKPFIMCIKRNIKRNISVTQII